MKYLETESQRKSLTITTILFVIMFLLFFYFKLASSDMQIAQLEGGGGGGQIEVNFGDSEFGSGDNYKSLDLGKPEQKSVPLVSTNEVKDLVTQESDEAPVIASVRKTEKPEKKEVIESPVVKEDPKPSKSTSDALANILNGSKSKGGDGNDKVGGNKGKLTGNPNAQGYNGGGGTGTGSGGGQGSGQGTGIGSGTGSGYGNGNGSGYGNYQLAGRNALSKPQPRYICNEQGIVVVQISVDKLGKVISAEPGIRGTTNLAKCLLDQAKVAAMNTKWQSDNDAPEKQVGKIIYNFKLTE